MEAIYLAAIQAGIDEATFWRSTPYQATICIKAANKAKVEANLMSGWFSERFAREETLRGPQHYIQEWLQPADPETQRAQAEAIFHRMAADWGLEVEDVSQSE